MRESLENLERETLSPYASLSAETRGRERKEPLCDIRPEYQRDRDRILHCKAFRRLKHKTQVFLAPEGDHYRTRLTHTLEVAQIARTIAKSLRLNESLTEAIAMGHDLKGLNLTWEVKDGILNHRTAGRPSTLEGAIVRLSDKIAYINHDIDDAIRARMFVEEELPAGYTDVLGHSVRERLNRMIHDIIRNSMDKPQILMSTGMEEAMKGLRQWMFEHVYKNDIPKAEESKAQEMIARLYEYYMKHVDQLPMEYVLLMVNGEKKSRVVCDYIAGMSDIYAIDQFEALFVPKRWNIY